MKKMKKPIALLFMLVMAMAMSVSVFAADSTLTITTAKNHTYKVYQLLKGDVTTTDGATTFSNASKGANLKVTEGQTDAQAVQALLTAINGKENAELSRTAWSYVYFSDTVPAKYTVTAAENGGNKDTTVENGYYVVEDTASDGTIISRYMVSVVGPTTMAPKNSSVPSIDKQVKEVNDSDSTSEGSWAYSADYDIGDDVPFKLTASLPADYADYQTYYLSFNDTLDAGLTLKASTIVVKVGNTTLDNDDYYIYGSQNSFKVVIYDLKALDASKEDLAVTNNTKVTVEYSATLNANAVVGSTGNENEATLTYTTNPNITSDSTDYPEPGGSDTPDDPSDDDTPGTPTAPTDPTTPDQPSNPDGSDTPDDPSDDPEQPSNPGTTTPVTDLVFTYKVVVNKYKNSVADGNKLAGAEFTLSKVNKDTTTTVVQTYTVSKNTAGNEFTFSGLDAGIYVLTETATPPGYNTINPITFDITATHSNEGLTALSATDRATSEPVTFTATTSDGTLSTNVINKSGSLLPSTGGMGTTIFYVLGVILVLGAGVLLISKKRVASR